MRRAYKFRLYPNNSQETNLSVFLESLDLVWNRALATRNNVYENEKRSISFAHQCKELTGELQSYRRWRAEGRLEGTWLLDIPYVAIRDTLKRLDLAFQSFFRRIKEGDKAPGRPQMKKPGDTVSIPFNNYASGCTLVDLKGKPVIGHMDDRSDKNGFRLRVRSHACDIGLIRIRLHRSIKGLIKTVSIKKEANQWYAIFSCELADRPLTENNKPPVGVDVGLKHFCTTSDAETTPNPRFLKKSLAIVRRLNRSISRKKLRGKNWVKAQAKLARVHAQIARRRHAFHHEVADDLVRRYGLIGIEDLKVKAMLESKNGYRLGKHISDVGWRSFFDVLETKGENTGTRVVSVDPRGTTKDCSGCGYPVPKTLRDRKHKCPQCGLELDRDFNAAVNIRDRALDTSPSRACGA